MADTDSASGGGGGERGSGVKLDLEKTHYDTLIVGTGLTESILAASLSNNPAHSVLHIDSNPWYGNTSASLSLRELISWSNVAHEEGEDSTSIYAPQLRFPAFEVEGEGQDAMPSEPPAPLVSLDRHFALSLCPTLLPGSGPTIDVLIRSGVASYCTFRMLEHTFVYQPSSSSASDASDALAGLKRVPSSKEDIFKDRTISLPDKRRLMKVLTEVTSSLDSQQSQSTSTDQPFLDFLSKGQGLSTPLASALAYGVALCSSQQEPTSQALNKMRTHMRSMGKYGQGAYLVGQYGGAGELAQGYCRACAVSGGTYILGHKLRSVRREVSVVDGSSSQVWKADIGGNEVTADWLVLDQDHSHLAGGGESGEKDDEGFDLVLGHVVLNRPFHLPRSSSANAEEKDPLPPETALVAFPPEGGDEMTTFVLMNGEGTFSTPKGQYIYYLMTSVPRSDQRSSSEILLKVRDRVLALTEGAKEEWKPAPSSNDQQTSLPSTTPLPPILEAYHRRRIPAAASLTTSADDRLLRVPFPPSLPQASSSTTSSSSPPLPGLSTSLDTATSLAESLFWIIGGGEKARAKAEAAQNRKSRRERDEEEFAGRAVALAGVRDQKEDAEEEEEEEEEVIWDFFPKKADRVDDDDD